MTTKAKDLTWWEILDRQGMVVVKVETCLYWSEVWVRVGYWSKLMRLAVESLHEKPLKDWPAWGNAFVKYMDGWMSAKTLELAMQGELPRDHAEKLRPQWEPILEDARAKSRSAARFPDDNTTPEAHRLKSISKFLAEFDRQTKAQLGNQGIRSRLPELRGIPR